MNAMIILRFLVEFKTQNALTMWIWIQNYTAQQSFWRIRNIGNTESFLIFCSFSLSFKWQMREIGIREIEILDSNIKKKTFVIIIIFVISFSIPPIPIYTWKFRVKKNRLKSKKKRLEPTENRLEPSHRLRLSSKKRPQLRLEKRLNPGDYTRYIHAIYTHINALER